MDTSPRLASGPAFGNAGLQAATDSVRHPGAARQALGEPADPLRQRELRERALEAENVALQRENERLRRAVRHLERAQAVARTGSWRLNVRCNELLWSDECARIFGFAPGMRLTYETFLDTVHPEDRAEVDRAWSAALRGEPYDIEHRIRVGDEVRWVRERATLDFDAAGRLTGGFGTAQDITERKAVENALREAQAQAEQANAAKSRFLAAASHDLRQPLSALSLYVGVLEHRFSRQDDTLVPSIRDCVASLSELLGDLLDLSKLDAGVVAPNTTDFALDDVLGRIISAHGPEARLKGLELRYAAPSMVARTDPVLFARMVGNLVANAVRYTERGGVLVGCRRRAGKLWVEVWDTGIGIPADKTGVIFEEFKQLGNEGRTRGSGLGLAIVARMAAVLGLELRVASCPGRGSLFAVEVPRGRARAQVPAPQATYRSLRIALVEDNPDVLRALSCFLSESGHEAVGAATGEQLLARLGGEAPDVVIADYRLAEGETGFQAITAVRAVFGAAVPALILTGDTDPALLRGMAERGVVVHHKPIELGVLHACIARLTERRGAS